jgi:Domain of unknown function (DUF5666)
MFQAARKQMRAVAMLGVAAALVVGGVAAAQGNSQSGSQGNGSGQSAGGHPPGPPPLMGIAMKGLTYAELHVQNKEGEAETIRIDQGKVKSVGDSSITLTENDESEVTVAVDSDTEVMGKPGDETSLSDLEAGQQVSVSAPEGEAARAIMVLPKKGDIVAAGFRGGPMAPPPGAPGAPDERRSGN